MNQQKRSQKKLKQQEQEQQLQTPWLLTVSKMSHMLCHSGLQRDGDIKVLVV